MVSMVELDIPLKTDVSSILLPCNTLPVFLLGGLLMDTFERPPKVDMESSSPSLNAFFFALPPTLVLVGVLPPELSESTSLSSFPWNLNPCSCSSTSISTASVVSISMTSLASGSNHSDLHLSNASSLKKLSKYEFASGKKCWIYGTSVLTTHSASSATSSE